MSIVLTPEVWTTCEEQISREASHWSMKFPGGRHARTREDLYQEGWVVCMKVLEAFQPGRARIGTFLTTCLRNRFRDLLDAAQKRRAFHAEGLDGLIQNQTPDERTTGGRHLHRLVSDAMSPDQVAAFATLTAREREMASWLANADGSVSQVAREHHLSPAVVTRIKLHLAEKLGLSV